MKWCLQQLSEGPPAKEKIAEKIAHIKERTRECGLVKNLDDSEGSEDSEVEDSNGSDDSDSDDSDDSDDDSDEDGDLD